MEKETKKETKKVKTKEFFLNILKGFFEEDEGSKGSKGSKEKINLKRFAEWPWYLKLFLAMLTIFGSYNSFSEYHITNYIINMDYTNLFNYAFILTFLGFWLLMTIGIKKNIGIKGIFGLILIFGLVFGGMYQKGMLDVSGNSIVIGIEIILSLIIFLGLMWPDIRKKLFGVRVVDEEDTDGMED
jgi:protein-S-isoprenylcysteine O-methyltransferase Ste14